MVAVVHSLAHHIRVTGARMRIVVTVLVAIAVSLAVFSFAQRATLNDLQEKNRALASAVADKTQAARAVAKTNCSKQAAAVFHLMGYSDNEPASKEGIDSTIYTNHYNPVLKRCLMTLENTNWTGGHVVITKSIFDADERTAFGSYAWVSSDTKKFYEVKPMQCSMTPAGHDETICRSSDEWDNYVKSLMS